LLFCFLLPDKILTFRADKFGDELGISPCQKRESSVKNMEVEKIGEGLWSQHAETHQGPAENAMAARKPLKFYGWPRNNIEKTEYRP
jgi:hypothetical protein